MSILSKEVVASESVGNGESNPLSSLSREECYRCKGYRSFGESFFDRSIAFSFGEGSEEIPEEEFCVEDGQEDIDAIGEVDSSCYCEDEAYCVDDGVDLREEGSCNVGKKT